jgi:GT2 family glycosyltransferase
VVTHQSAGFLPACLESLDEHAEGLELVAVVADSGSTDRVESVCRERGAVFLGGPNHGFGAAVNRALAHEAVQRARYVLVMNPDVAIVEGSLAEFAKLCDQRPACGVFGPRQIDQDRRLVCSIGREPSPADSWRGWRTGWPAWVWDVKAYEREARCDWVMGAFMLIRRQALEAVGGFDERFFLFSEEVDLCTQARRAGWEVAYLPQLTVMHWTADRPLDEHRARMLRWSELVYMRKWYGLGDRASMRVALIARLTRRLVRRLRSRESARGEWVELCAALRFRRRRYGPAR